MSFSNKRWEFLIADREQLQQLTAEKKGNSKKAVLLLPGREVFVRILYFPLTARKKIDQLVRFQLAEKLPVPLNEMYLEYYLEKRDEQLMVIAFAVPREYLNQLYFKAKAEGIKLRKILPGGLIYYLIHKNEVKVESPAVFIDLNPLEVNIIADSIKGVYLRTAGVEDSEDLLEEIKKTFTYLFEEVKLSRPDSIYLNGKEVTDQQLQLELLDLVQSENKTKKNFIFQVGKYSKKTKFNFLQQLPAEKKRKQKKASVWAWLLILLILVTNFLNAGLLLKMDEKYLGALQAQLGKYQQAAAKVKEIKAEVLTVRERNAFIEEQMGNATAGYLPWLIELSRILPPGTKLEQLSFKDRKLAVLTGQADSAAEVMARLEESAYFSRLRFSGTINREEEGERFQIAGELNNVIE